MHGATLKIFVFTYIHIYIYIHSIYASFGCSFNAYPTNVENRVSA